MQSLHFLTEDIYLLHVPLWITIVTYPQDGLSLKTWSLPGDVGADDDEVARVSRNLMVTHYPSLFLLHSRKTQAVGYLRNRGNLSGLQRPHSEPISTSI